MVVRAVTPGSWLYRWGYYVIMVNVSPVMLARSTKGRGSWVSRSCPLQSDVQAKKCIVPLGSHMSVNESQVLSYRSDSLSHHARANLPVPTPFSVFTILSFSWYPTTMLSPHVPSISSATLYLPIPATESLSAVAVILTGTGCCGAATPPPCPATTPPSSPTPAPRLASTTSVSAAPSPSAWLRQRLKKHSVTV